MHSPKIERIEVAARGDVRRAKLYYLRGRVGKRARVRERRYTGPEEIVEAGLLHDPAAQARPPRLPRPPTTRCRAARSTSRRSRRPRRRADVAGDEPVVAEEAEATEAAAAEDKP